MNLFSITAHFLTEEDCRKHFKSERDKIGLTCKCGSTEHFWIKSRLSYECKKCRSRTSLKSGTIMENSNLPFLIWYKAMFLMSVTKKGFSTKEIQKQLGLKIYEPVCAIVLVPLLSYFWLRGPFFGFFNILMFKNFELPYCYRIKNFGGRINKFIV